MVEIDQKVTHKEGTFLAKVLMERQIEVKKLDLHLTLEAMIVSLRLAFKL